MMLYMIEPSFNNFDNDLIEIRSGKHRTILPFSLPFPLTNVECVKEGDVPINGHLVDMRTTEYIT